MSFIFNIRRKQKYLKILINNYNKLVIEYVRSMNEFYAIFAQIENIVRLEQNYNRF